MAFQKYKVQHTPDGVNPSTKEETVEVSYIHTDGGWVEFGDGSGIVLRLPERTVHRIERVNG